MEILCPGENPTFLHFFDLSTRPALLFYSYIPTIIVALALGFFIWSRNRQGLVNRIFALISLFFSLWVINIFVLWVASYNDILMFGWQLTPALEIPIFLLAIYFTHVFTNRNQSDIKPGLKAFFLAIMAGVFIILPTSINTRVYGLEDCEAVLGYLWPAMYIFEMIAITWIAGICIKRYVALEKSNELRKQIFYMGIGIVSFLVLFVGSNILGEVLAIQEISFIGSLGMAIFLAFLVFMIVKFKTFNAKLIATQALVVALILVMSSLIFIDNVDVVHWIILPSIILAIIMSSFLVKSVKREVEQREYLERISKELSSANGQLRVLDKQKNEFLSFASHDLKSPIALIKQFATLIYDGTYKEPQKVHETVLKIKNTADRAVNMVNTFLDLRKIEEGRMEYNFEKKNIVEFVSGITADFTLLAKQQKNIDVSFSSSTPDIQVTLDTNTLRQVIQNFLDNSMKYTEAGWIKVEIINEQKTALIKVSDSGLGMSKELLPILFGQFHRDPGTAKKIQGTGLGLYIAKQIVLAHHGDTWAESEGPGKGSQFYIRLPKA